MVHSRAQQIMLIMQIIYGSTNILSFHLNIRCMCMMYISMQMNIFTYHTTNTTHCITCSKCLWHVISLCAHINVHLVSVTVAHVYLLNVKCMLQRIICRERVERSGGSGNVCVWKKKILKFFNLSVWKFLEVCTGHERLCVATGVRVPASAT